MVGTGRFELPNALVHEPPLAGFSYALRSASLRAATFGVLAVGTPICSNGDGRNWLMADG